MVATNTVAKKPSGRRMAKQVDHCYHCGDECADDAVVEDEHHFCCNGCRQVYLLLHQNNLCTYYDLDKTPGLKAKGKFTTSRFAYLDNVDVLNQLAQFQSEQQVNITFHLPQMHCASCIFLLENLHRINEGIITSKSDFQKKQVFVAFNPQVITLRQVVELMAFAGYEPSISLNDAVEQKKASPRRQQIYRIGVAGFCFSNIMMLSFPEYFSGGNIGLAGLKETFSWIIFLLSLPVLFYSARPFFTSAWKGLRQKYVNVDAPIVLATLVTFSRSYYEIISGSGSGYLDSGAGIVFFMLIGRWFQDKTYDSFSFDRDYTSYFPLGATVIEDGEERGVPITQLTKGSRIRVRNDEMVPADAVLIKGQALVDYSFVSGETTPVAIQQGQLVYAGGKQTGSAIELEIIKEPSQSYITQLWNSEGFQSRKNAAKSFIHPWSRYFTLALFTVALSALVYWAMHDTSRILPAVSSVLIVACPCSLLLATTFTYGNMLRIFGKNKLYLKNAAVIESLAKADTVVFDKTGTLTQHELAAVTYEGDTLTDNELTLIKLAATQSAHPLSKLVAASIEDNRTATSISDFREFAGKGLQTRAGDTNIRMGSAAFVCSESNYGNSDSNVTSVHIAINGRYRGRFIISNQYRTGIGEVAASLHQRQMNIHVLSGDNSAERDNLMQLFGKDAQLRFNQSPQQKLDYIAQLQQQHNNVLMLGDGLNDAGALLQSNTGIAVSDNTARFTPACDGILDGGHLQKTARFIAFAVSGKRIVSAIFIVSILYNIVGLSFAVQGLLSPMVAAILMPVSSITIVSLAGLLSSLSARLKGL